MKYDKTKDRAGTDEQFPYPMRLLSSDGYLHVEFKRVPKTFKDLGLKRFYPKDRKSWNEANEDDIFPDSDKFGLILEVMTLKTHDGRRDAMYNSEGRRRVFCRYNSKGKPVYDSIPTKSGSKWTSPRLRSSLPIDDLKQIRTYDHYYVGDQLYLPQNVYRTYERYGSRHERWQIWIRARLIYENNYRTAWVSNPIKYYFTTLN